jgi:nitroimidazol reductase NimA-like FMN-containing flavoprotein (pyridoxamine 5'-phosphate oxidase superfamily)
MAAAPGRFRTLTQGEATFVDWQRVARVATVGSDGVPHNVPICPVLSDGRIAFATEVGRKVRNIRENAQVCMAFDEYTEIWDDLKQVVITGTATIVETGPRFQAVRKALLAKFPQYPSMASGVEEGDSLIVDIEIENVFSSGVTD